MGDLQVNKLHKEIESLHAHLARTRNIIKVSEASRELKEYATTHTQNDPLLQGWQGQNIWLEPMGGRCCVMI